MNKQRQKSDFLTNIETLWQDAEHSADSHAKSTFQRISDLMQDADSVEIVANDTHPSSMSYSDDVKIKTLAALVEIAANDQPSNSNKGKPFASSPSSFDEAKARMDSVSQLKPPQQVSFNTGTTEYAFGAIFSELVRHAIRDYIHNEVEGVIKNALKSEPDAHFTGHDEDNR